MVISLTINLNLYSVLRFQNDQPNRICYFIKKKKIVNKNKNDIIVKMLLSNKNDTHVMFTVIYGVE